jgi:hypothetical protein
MKKVILFILFTGAYLLSIAQQDSISQTSDIFSTQPTYVDPQDYIFMQNVPTKSLW